MDSRPAVTLHFAQSLDGRIAFASGGPRAILSSEEGLLVQHRARAENQAVLVGIRTALLDDPRLTVRACPGPQPIRVVLDSALRLPSRCRLLEAEGPVVVLGAAGRAATIDERRLRAAGADVVIGPATPQGLVAIGPALAALRARGVMRLLVEGGAAVLTSFLRAGTVDRVTVEIASCLLGAPGLSVLGELAPAAADPVRLSDMRLRAVGDNVLLEARVEHRPARDGARS